MPEYVAPGTYVEEVSFRSRSIEGQSTSTAAFVGPATFGPIDSASGPITSLADFEQIYGDGRQFHFSGSSPHHNYLWHAVRAFFAEGGTRLYLARVAHDPQQAAASFAGLTIRARYPGAAGNLRVRLTLNVPAITATLTVDKRVYESLPLDLTLPADAPIIIETPADTAALKNALAQQPGHTMDVQLQGGSDGQRPFALDYTAALKLLEGIDEISMLAAPGSTFDYRGAYRTEADGIISQVIAHAEKMRYRIAVLDSGDGQTIAEVSTMRARIDSTRGALYYPWIKIADPVTEQEIALPPSGFVCGIYARTDAERSVVKAPANQLVNLATGLETVLTQAQQEVLNPLGVNCFRFFQDRGYRLFGARTVSSDPEWKYVNVRRYFAYLEHSIDKGTQWAVFEPNGQALWDNVRNTITDFLYNEWKNGALLGTKPEQAFFVRCDRTTMTQNDLDNGRLVYLVGVAVVKPAEFVIFRIGQWTADRK